jgi:transaldolase
MSRVKNIDELSREIHDFLRAGFSPQFGKLRQNFSDKPLWARLKELGTELWLDTGSIEDASRLFCRQFSALTTNNTLLNKEVQTGRYDDLIAQVWQMFAKYPHLTGEQKILEIAFILNAWHGLRLVEKFDAYVSVEEHTALANDTDRAVDYAKRFHAVCPERFIIKIPFTPAGLLAAKRLSAEAVPVNHTLGFSARQNYIIARIAKPAYVNVFLGRLNSFVVDNDLGDGSFIGEKATLASQTAVRKLRKSNLAKTKQIGASFRAGWQVRDLAGIDVMTIPPKIAAEFEKLRLQPARIDDRTTADYKIGINPDPDIAKVRLDSLWDIEPSLISCIDQLEKENLDSFSAGDLIDFFKDHRCGDTIVNWTDKQIKTSTEEGKIPKLENWRDALADKTIGLDSLMNLAGLCSFTTDQTAMDNRIKNVLAKAKTAL